MGLAEFQKKNSYRDDTLLNSIGYLKFIEPLKSPESDQICGKKVRYSSAPVYEIGGGPTFCALIPHASAIGLAPITSIS